MRKTYILLALFFAAISQWAAAQQKISGRVFDSTGTGINGATISVKGTRQGTTTGLAGNFTLTVSSGSGTLVVTAVGFSATEVPISSNVQVQLTTTAANLSEVVVTALGIKTTKDKLGTSQSTVGGGALTKSGETSVLNALSSKASGVQVVRSGGDPGAGTYIQIRGQNTITGNTQPLFVVDGIPISNSSFGWTEGAGTVQQSRASDLNPEDIESLEVLKGTAAAAIYGTRAANGVVLITTKKGKTGRKLNIALTSTYSIDDLNKSVPLQTNYGQGSGGIYGYGANSNNRSWGDKIADRSGAADAFLTNGAYVLLPDGSRRYLVASGTAANPHGGKNSRQVYDHATDLFHNGSFWDNTLALSGGDANGVYYASISNLNQNGILKAGSDYDRRSFRLNADRRFGIVKLAGTFNYVYTNSNRVQQGSNISGIFLGGLRTAPDFDNSIYEGTYVDASGAQFPYRQLSYRNPIGVRTNSGYDNPFWIINRIKNRSTVNRAIGSFEATVSPTSWLSIVNRSGIDYYGDSRLEYYPTISSAFPGGQLTLTSINETQFNNDMFARGNFNLTKSITLNALLGWNFNHRDVESNGSSVRNFITENVLNPFYDLGNSAADARFPFNTKATIRTAGVFGQLSFGLYDQLYIDLTGRREVASTFNGKFFYPSASVAWQFSKLLRTNDFFSFGKARVSYGEIGIQPDAYLLTTYFSPQVVGTSWGPTLDASSATYGGGIARNATRGNPNLKPERKKELELGGDLRFWKNRITLSGTYYHNKTVDGIFAVQVPASTGYEQINDNAAEIENKGVEADLGVNWLNRGALSITSNVVWSRNRNKVLTLKGVQSYFLNGFTGASSRAVEGYPLGVLWGVDFDRDAKGALVLDANGFPQNAASESVIGNPNPDWTGGISTTISFKKVRLSFLFDHVQGGDVWNGTKGALYTFGIHAETGNEVTAPSALKTASGGTIAAGTRFRGAVRDFGAGPVALTEAWYTNLGGGFGPVSSQFIEDGTRTRLREVGLGYTISGAGFTRATRLQAIDISATGRNLVLWTNYTGIDPETNLTGPSNGRGLDYFNNPSTRSYLLTLKVTF